MYSLSVIQLWWLTRAKGDVGKNSTCQIVVHLVIYIYMMMRITWACQDYSFLQLENGMKCIIGSDPKCDKESGRRSRPW